MTIFTILITTLAVLEIITIHTAIQYLHVLQYKQYLQYSQWNKLTDSNFKRSNFPFALVIIIFSQIPNVGFPFKTSAGVYIPFLI